MGEGAEAGATAQVQPGAAGARALAAVLAAVAAAHASGLGGAFQFDDFRVIVGDPRVRSLGAWWRAMPGIRPLLKLSFALDHQLGLGLVGFHAQSLAIHLAATALAFLLLVRMGRQLALPAAAAPLGAALFALHPAQTEAVTYLSGRSAALGGALALASVLAFVAGRDRDRPRPLLVHGLSPLLMVLALCARESAVAIPAALLLAEALDPAPFRWRRALAATAVHWVVLGAAAAGFLASPTYRGMVEQSLTLRPPLENALTHARALLWLAGQVLRPDLLSVDPGLAPVASAGAGAVLSGLVVLGAAAGGVLLLRGWPVAGFAVCWFLLWAAPQGVWLPRAEPASDRQLYVALLGPAWLAAVWLARLRSPPRRALAASVLLVGLGAGTALRNRVYRDEVTFWSDVVEKAPGHARGHANLGYALALACRPEEADRALTRAMALDPDDPTPAWNRRFLRAGTLLGPDERARCGTAPGRLREGEATSR